MKTTTLFHLGLSAMALATTSLSYADQQKPDVLFFLVDDLSYNALHALGSRDVISPNFDKIIKRGTSFSNTYNMGGWNGAISIASRTQLMTGLYLWNNNKTAEKDKYAAHYAQHQYWPQLMKDAGYKTFHTGKWHVDQVPSRNLFDSSVVLRPGMPSTHESAYNRPLSRDDNQWKPWDTSLGGYWKDGKHWSEIAADQIIAYMQENKDAKEPLFMCTAFNAVHDPRESPKEYVEMYDVDKIHVPVSFMTEAPYMDAMEVGHDLRDERLAPWPRTKYAIQKHRQEYYALITHLDAQMGRIMQALEASGRADRTLIVVTADNGLSIGRHGLMGKQTMYDHSMKIPLIFAGCGVPKGETRQQLCYMQDLVPTVLEMIGVDKPKSMQFVSQLPVLQDKQCASQRESIYGAYKEKQRMVRNERYKLFFIPDARVALLFDLKEDPHELHNLYGTDAAYTKIAKELAQQYLKLSQEAGDEFDITALYPELF